jgi:hypothetical protein
MIGNYGVTDKIYMKPDLGLRYLRDGYSKEVIISFYGVSFEYVSFLTPDLCSVMLEYPYNGVVHAISFDFSDKIFGQLLSKLPAVSQQSFISSISGKRLPFTASLPMQVAASVIECHLGELQQLKKRSLFLSLLRELSRSLRESQECFQNRLIKCQPFVMSVMLL